MLQLKQNWIGKVLNTSAGSLVLKDGLSQSKLKEVYKFIPQAIDHVEKKPKQTSSKKDKK